MTYAISAFTLLVGQQEGQLACKNWVVRYWHGYLSWLRCKWFAYGPAYATAMPSFASLKSMLICWCKFVNFSRSFMRSYLMRQEMFSCELSGVTFAQIYWMQHVRMQLQGRLIWMNFFSPLTTSMMKVWFNYFCPTNSASYISGVGNGYRPQTGDAMWLGSKGRHCLFHYG